MSGPLSEQVRPVSIQENDRQLSESYKYLVVVVKINPSAKTLNCMPPFGGIAHNNSAAFLVVLFNPELHDCFFSRYAQLLVDLVFNGKTMCVPPKTTLDMKSLHRPVSWYDVLDC